MPRLSRVVFVLCLIAAWSLLWLDSSLLFPYTTGKTWLFRSIVEMAFALSLVIFMSRGWVVSGAIFPAQKSDLRALLWVMLTFLIWTAVTDFFGIDRYRSFWSNWERMGGLIDYLHWAMYLFCLLTVLNKARTRYLLANLVLVITLVCILALLDTGQHRVSTLGNRIYVGNLAALGVFIGVYLLAGKFDSPVWITHLTNGLFIIAIMIMGAAVIASASRGAVLALVGGGAVVILGYTVLYVNRSGRIVASLLVLAAAGFCTWLITQTGPIQTAMQDSDLPVAQRLGEISLNDQTTADRLENWKIATDAALSRPVGGWGQENYMIAFNDYYRAGMIDRAKLWFDRAHNAYLDVFVASGIPGLVLYGLLLALPVWITGRNTRWSLQKKLAVEGFFIAFAIKNIVGFDTFSSTLAWISVLAVVWVESAQLQVGKAPVYTHRTPSHPSGLLVLAFVFGAFSASYWLNIKPYQDNLRFANLLRQPQVFGSELLEEILRDESIEWMYAQNGRLAVFDSLLSQADTTGLTSTELAIRNNVLQRAGLLIDDALRHQPKNYRIKYNAAILFARLGHYEVASRMLEELTQAIPQRTAFWYALAEVYAADDDHDAALKARGIAQKLNPDWRPPSDNVRKSN